MWLAATLIVTFAGCSGGLPSDDNEGPGTIEEIDAGTGDGLDSGADVVDGNDSEGLVSCDEPLTEGVSTLAGCSESGDVDGPRSAARFRNPVNVAYRDGQVYAADFDNNKLRSIGTHTYSTSSIDLGPNFRRPFGLAFASDETLFVSTDNNPEGANSAMTGTVWRVNLPTKTAHVVASDMGRLRGIIVLPDGRIAATDYLHHVVEIIDAETGQATVIAGVWGEPGMSDGSGADARFSMPCGIGRLPGNILVVADSANNRIRLVTLGGTTSTLAGSGEPGFHDGPTDEAMFNGPLGVSVAVGGDVYVSDAENYRVRLISDGEVTTVAGSGLAGYADDDDPLAAQFYGLEGLVLTPDGTKLYVADGNRGDGLKFNRIRQVQLP